MPKIGDTIWIFDDCSRKYTIPTPEEKKAGKIYGDLIWRGHWRPVVIVGETRVSWLIDKGRFRENKIPKKPAFIHDQSPCFSEADLDDRCYVHDNAYSISQAVRDMKDAAVLRQIATLVGYKAK